jgi:hypothetical protein
MHNLAALPIVGKFFGSSVDTTAAPIKEGFTVTCHAAHEITNTQWVGQQNPYCTINVVRAGKLENKVARTLMRDGGGKNPVWDAAHYNTHFLPNNGIESIEVELW